MKELSSGFLEIHKNTWDREKKFRYWYFEKKPFIIIIIIIIIINIIIIIIIFIIVIFKYFLSKAFPEVSDLLFPSIKN